jgi:hypothetical protein
MTGLLAPLKLIRDRLIDCDLVDVSSTIFAVIADASFSEAECLKDFPLRS